MWNLILVALIVSYVIDISGFIESTENYIHWKKPFNCSRCMTLWCTLVFTFITMGFKVHLIPIYAFCFFLSYFSDITTSVLTMVRDFFVFLIIKINKKLL